MRIDAPGHAAEAPSWSRPRCHPQLAEGELHVWQADLRTVPDEVLCSLSPAERDRAARFPSCYDGLLWARARGELRVLAARYLDVEPAALEFTRDRAGKPAITHTARGGPPAFNVSHSGLLALYAFTSVSAVGVDVQAASARRIDTVAIATRLLGSEAGRRLARLGPAEREREFLQLWARCEAGLKCEGAGLTDRRFRRTDDSTPGHNPWVANLEMGQGAAGAVAARRAPGQLRTFLSGM